MSSFRRVILGSLASWVSIIINLLIQLFLIPIYLQYWTLDNYGIWVSIHATSSLLTMLDKGHQTYIGYELLKIGKFDLKRYKECFWSSVIVSVQSGCLLIFLTILLVKLDLLYFILPKNISLSAIQQVGDLLIILNISWVVNYCIGGILVKGLLVFGYYHHLAWWGVCCAIIINFIPLIGVANGYGIVETGILFGFSTLFINIFMHFDMIRLLRKENILNITINLRMGYWNFFKSIFISLKDILENLRQQGIRVLLAPLSGSYGLVAFTTMRTGANVALQGLSSITNPLMPELMRFLHSKEQNKFEASLGSVWIIVIGILCPCVLVLQDFIEPLFLVWTRNKIVFNATLFALLSLGVLVYGAAQPAIAIVTGNNLLKQLIIISALTTIIMIVGLFILIPRIGIVGSGIILLLSEIISLFLYQLHAKLWLKINGLYWPNKQFNTVLIQIFIVAVSMILMINFYNLRHLILLISLIIQVFIIKIYWKNLPNLVVERISSIIKKMPFISIIFK